MEQPPRELPVRTLVEGLHAILDSLAPTLGQRERWATDLNVIRETLGRLTPELEAACLLDQPCALSRKAPPYGGPVSC